MQPVERDVESRTASASGRRRDPTSYLRVGGQARTMRVANPDRPRRANRPSRTFGPRRAWPAIVRWASAEVCGAPCEGSEAVEEGPGADADQVGHRPPSRKPFGLVADRQQGGVGDSGVGRSRRSADIEDCRADRMVKSSPTTSCIIPSCSAGRRRTPRGRRRRRPGRARAPPGSACGGRGPRWRGTARRPPPPRGGRAASRGRSAAPWPPRSTHDPAGQALRHVDVARAIPMRVRRRSAAVSAPPDRTTQS